MSIKIYLIARISKTSHTWNEEVCGVLKNPIKVFLPHKHNPYNIQHTKLSKEVYDTDIEAMKKSDIALALPEFGCDCSYEVGWFSVSTRPIVFYVDTQILWLRNWMVKGGLSHVVTTNKRTYRILCADPILKFKKVMLINSLKDLQQIITDIYEKNN